MTKEEKEKIFLELNTILVKFWKEHNKPDMETRIEILKRMTHWYENMGTITLDTKEKLIMQKLEQAPDKFYAEVNYDTGFVCGYAEPTKSDDIEYIRKDALLEWAQNRYNSTRFKNVRLVMDEVIEKLNSM